jgi:hypothetical protein
MLPRRRSDTVAALETHARIYTTAADAIVNALDAVRNVHIVDGNAAQFQRELEAMTIVRDALWRKANHATEMAEAVER